MKTCVYMLVILLLSKAEQPDTKADCAVYVNFIWPLPGSVYTERVLLSVHVSIGPGEKADRYLPNTSYFAVM